MQKNIGVLCADFGFSGSKFLLWLLRSLWQKPEPESVYEAHLVSPVVTPLTVAKYEEELEQIQMFAPGRFGMDLVRYRYEGRDCYWSVGGAEVTLVPSQRKWQLAIVKLLAALGSIQRSTYAEDEITLSVGLVLPMDELKDREALSKILRAVTKSESEGNGKAADGVWINGVALNVRIAQLKISVEGAGLVPESDGDEGVFMFGHVDLSFLRFRNGKVLGSASQTFSGEGFHSFLSDAGLSGDAELNFAEAVANGALDSITHVPQWVVQSNVEQARAQWLLAHDERLRSLNCSGLKKLHVGGGGWGYFADELANFFEVPIDPCLALQREFGARFKVSDRATRERFADLYGYWRRFPGIPEYRKAVRGVAPNTQSLNRRPSDAIDVVHRHG
jgi:hypothetical protein